MPTINREEFLRQCESVMPGLSTREIIEQSSCFIFQKGKVITYNDEIACTQESSLNIKGAVQAMPLINILRKLKEDELDISAKKEKLIIKGKRKQASINMETEILIPIDDVETPKKWKDLPDDFADAISIVQQCAGKDESRFDFVCVHLHPDRIEACDGYQAALYKTTIPIKKPTLVRKESLKYIISLDMTKFSKTKNWIHFKNSSGLIMSCRRWIYDKKNFPDIFDLMKMKGTKTSFPKGLIEACDKAEVFSAENAEENQVIIDLQKNKLKITGKGASGKYYEYKKIKYKGKPMTFAIAPALLIDLVNHHNTCRISKDKLKVVTGKYSYVTVLQKPE